MSENVHVSTVKRKDAIPALLSAPLFTFQTQHTCKNWGSVCARVRVCVFEQGRFEQLEAKTFFAVLFQRYVPLSHWSSLCHILQSDLPLQNIDQLSLLNSNISPLADLTSSNCSQQLLMNSTTKATLHERDNEKCLEAWCQWEIRTAVVADQTSLIFLFFFFFYSM